MHNIIWGGGGGGGGVDHSCKPALDYAEYAFCMGIRETSQETDS